MGFWSALAGLALALGLYGSAQAACTLAKEELPVTMVGMEPTVPAKLNGVAVNFIVDSGAFFSLITPAAAEQLGLHTYPAPFGFFFSGVGGVASGELTRVKAFALGADTIPNIEFLVGGSDVAAPAVGLIGQNVLHFADVEYDLADGVVRLMRPSGCGGRDLAYWAHGKPISIVPILGVNEGGDSHTRSMALVNGVRINVLFDTGASTSVLSLDAARRAGVKPSDPGVIPADVSRGVGRNLMRTWIAPFASFQLGDEQVKTTRLRIGDTGLDGVDMLLGADFFLSHRVYVANSQRKIYFTYNGGPAAREAWPDLRWDYRSLTQISAL